MPRTAKGGQVEVWFPSADEIQLRKDAQRFMQDFNWDQEVIDSIMYDDTPPISFMVQMLYAVGPQEAYERIKRYYLA